ncbi:MAG: PfkB family carbohydrate kinase [Actinomycetota bacterium]|nr:PfkB family carbohydrate kinase [Actinomycetota bacterium]
MTPGRAACAGAPRAVVFGEALVDVFPDQEVVAGAPLHVAVHLAARGWLAWLVTRIGNDAAGARIRDLLERFGVETSLIEVDPALPTGRATVEIAGDDHGFVIHRPAAWDAIAGPARLPPHDALAYGTLAARDERSRSTLERLLATSSAPLRVFDVNVRPPDVSREVLELGLGVATVLKVNGGELEVVAALLDFAPVPESYFAVAPSLEWLCITRGEEGAELYARLGETWAIERISLDVVDTVGAGDAFTAGLLDALVHGYGGEQVLWAAQAAAASVLTCRGGLPAPRAS